MGSGGDLGRGGSVRKCKRVNVHFKIPYTTRWGQSVFIIGSDPLLGAWVVKEGVKMTPLQEGDILFWQIVMSVPEHFDTEYSYCVVDENLDTIRRESGSVRSLTIPEGLPQGANIEAHDFWQVESSSDLLLSRAAYRRVLLGEDDEENFLSIAETTAKSSVTLLSADALDLADTLVVRFKVECARLDPDQTICIGGSCPELGNWNNEEAVRLSKAGHHSWQCLSIIRREEFPIKYKYMVKSKSGVAPEIGAERVLSLFLNTKEPASMIIASDGGFRASPWRGSGVAIPVFSIRSEESVGSGEFLDLNLMIDLASKTGMRLVQLLPVNDTSVNMMWWDSYPYSSLSVFALHPLYLRLQALSNNLPIDIQDEIESFRVQLDLKEVDYDATMNAKISIAKKVYHLEKDQIFASAAFGKYFEENKEWLRPYAAFCFLRDLFGTADHSQWGLYSEFTPEKLEKLISTKADHHEAIGFSYYIQFQLHSQLSTVAEYAKRKHVVLKGDLPIGVGRNSVDTWQYPTLFRMNASTGAPPDCFDMNGQNWGFPTYNWEEMSIDNYGWWRARLSQMAKYFSAYRIDHVLGFFRIWEMPDHAVTGLMGRFRPSIPLSTEELQKEGIWDFDRLSTPYVRCHLLQEKFGDRWVEIADKYFDEFEHLCYQFKVQYNTEKKIVAATTPEGDVPAVKPEAGSDQAKLFDLLHEVILMRDPEDPSSFYPRFELEQSTSFQELDDHSKEVLLRLYHDYFFQRQEELWRDNAMKTLPALMNSSDMLACGEDLGMVPDCVYPVLNELGLLGLRIQRMPVGDEEFGIPADYEYMTVCAPSCHDSSTMRAWWEEDAARRERYHKDILGCDGPAPDTCEPDIAHRILQQHLESPSAWAIFPVQDLLALKEMYAQRPAKEETINNPCNPRHYWRFRLHVTMETLLADAVFLATLRGLVMGSHRASCKDFEDTKAFPQSSMEFTQPMEFVEDSAEDSVGEDSAEEDSVEEDSVEEDSAEEEEVFECRQPVNTCSGEELDDAKHIVENGHSYLHVVTV